MSSSLLVIQIKSHTIWPQFVVVKMCYHRGAPTSPALSNIVGKTLDKRLYSFARTYDLKYSRYADDLAFSGEQIPSKFIEYISDIIRSCGFSVNDRKTILQQQKNRRRIITGISISDDAIKIPREYKRKLKQEIHCIRKFGISSHIRDKKLKKLIIYYVSLEKLNSGCQWNLKISLQLMR